MRGSLSIFLPQQTPTPPIMAPRTLPDHKSQTGFANANLETDKNKVLAEFLPIHIKTGTGIISAIAIVLLIFIVYKAVRNGLITQCWRACCKQNDPMGRSRHQQHLKYMNTYNNIKHCITMNLTMMDLPWFLQQYSHNWLVVHWRVICIKQPSWYMISRIRERCDSWVKQQSCS